MNDYVWKWFLNCAGMSIQRIMQNFSDKNFKELAYG
jgi:hypothetical protein